jgi:microcystin-dependent protein
MAQTPLIGAVFMFAGSSAPTGYMLCQGQLLLIQQYQALFTVLGTKFGGDGVTTFALPDLQSRVPIGAGQGPGLSNYTLGEAAGTESVTLLYNNMPAHSHTVNAVAGAGNQTSPASYLPATVSITATHPVPDFPGISAPSAYSNASPNATMNPNMIAAAGGNQPHTNIQPFLSINFIIAITGVFPA